MTPSTDSLSTNPTVPIATDKYGAPLSLPRKQTSVTPVLDQLHNWVKRTGRFQRLIEQGAVQSSEWTPPSPCRSARVARRHASTERAYARATTPVQDGRRRQDNATLTRGQTGTRACVRA